jgi:hypothetical protein
VFELRLGERVGVGVGRQSRDALAGPGVQHPTAAGESRRSRGHGQSPEDRSPGGHGLASLALRPPKG